MTVLTLAWKPKDGAWTALEDAKTLGNNGLSINNSPAEVCTIHVLLHQLDSFLNVLISSVY